MSRPVLQPSAKHPITIEESDARVTVSLDGHAIATSERTLVLREATYPPVYYVPTDDIAADALSGSDTETYCPFKGDASYFDASGVKDVGWTYREPYDAVAEIGDHIAFYPSKVDIHVA